MHTLLFMATLLSANCVQVESSLSAVMAGHGNSAAVQSALSRTLGWSASTSDGIVVSGNAPSVRAYPKGFVTSDVGESVPVRSVLSIEGRGPEPLTVSIPVEPDAKSLEIYRRVSPGMYLRLEGVGGRVGRAFRFCADRPGVYVLRTVDALSQPAALREKGLFNFVRPDPSPAAKANWRLVPESPELINGPVPIILLHGSGASRWEEFIDWAANSPEAEAFRAQFQIWNYRQPMKGVDAAIGFGRDYPAYDESIVAYLGRFIQQASTEGVAVDGVTYTFPSGPFAMIAHSHGGLVAQAFLLNYPAYAARCKAVVTLSSPMLGTPWATPQWMRHTLSRLGFSRREQLDLFLEKGIGDLFLKGYISTGRQSDLDMGWYDNDRVGGEGIPLVSFPVWSAWGTQTVTLSARDANLTWARLLPGIPDTSFEPAQQLSTYCGGLDYIVPERREDWGLDKYFLYGAYLTGEESVRSLAERSSWGIQPARDNLLENLGLRIAAQLMGLVASADSDAPLGTYALSDGFVPLQSQLMLDGRQEDPLYETKTVDGWREPVLPYVPREAAFAAHTLGNPMRLRILRDWSHLDTVTGRYNKDTGHSPLFPQVAEDLLSVFAADTTQ